MRDNKAIGSVAALVIAGSVLTLWFCITGGPGPRIDPAPHKAAGRVLARQTLSLLKPGGLVTVITRDTLDFQNPATDILFASFRKELTKGGAKVDSVQQVQVDPLRPVAVPSGDFCQLIKKTAKGSVIVSLMGPPVLTDAQTAQLGQVNPAIVAFCPGSVRDQVDLRSLFAQGLLQAAVVSKRNSNVKRDGHGTESEIFDQQFIAITPGNLASLSTASNASP